MTGLDAFIMNAALLDLNVISSDNSSKVIDSLVNMDQYILNMLKICLYLGNYSKSIVLKTIQRNSFFAHPDNVLLAMLQDDEAHVREMAVQRILKVRNDSKGNIVCGFQLPELRVDASCYYDLINCPKKEIIMKYSDIKMSNIISTGNLLEI